MTGPAGSQDKFQTPVTLSSNFPNIQGAFLPLAEIDFRVKTPRAEPVPFGQDPNPAAEAIVKDQRQAEFWKEKLHWKDSIAAKLRSVGSIAHAEKLDHCRSEASVKRCTSCGKQTVFWNRCDLFYCPACAPRLSGEKKDSVTAWTDYIGQPKHVVLTCRNTGTITKAHIQAFKSAFSRLRRSKFCTSNTETAHACDVATRKPTKRYSTTWHGGFYSLEITKEQNGWHLHLHALVDARFIDSVLLSEAWAHALDQDIAIVKVMDARNGEYLQEVLKYVVKGETIARWSGDDIASFINAFTGVRSFGVFGTLYRRRGEFRAQIDAIQKEPERCSCGCDTWVIMSVAEAQWTEETAGMPPPTKANAAPFSRCEEFALFGNARVLAAFAR